MKTAQLSFPNLNSETSSALHMVIHQRLHLIMCFSFDGRAEPEEVHVFKSTLLQSPNILHAAETSGAYEFIAEAVFPGMSAYQDFKILLSEPLARLVARHEESFFGKRFVRNRNKDTSLWVPTAHGLKRVDAQLIDKITAEGDYMRLYSQGNSWLLHTTMRSLERRLDETDFVRLHRSSIVRLNFIDCLSHRGRHWIVQLHDGTCEKVSRMHEADVLSASRCRSTTPQPTLSTT